MKRKTIILTAITGVIVLVGGAWLLAQGPQPAFGQLTATPAGYVATTSTAVPNIVANHSTSVAFSIPIPTPTLNPTTVQLQQVDSSGHVLSTVSRLYDDGSNGDAVAGDKVFNAQITLKEPTVGRLHFRVAAAFRGNTLNAWSTPIPFDVDPIMLPPDPGDAGKQTLIGVDSDHDGVRDDVQRYIAYAFQATTTQSAMRQEALAIDQLMTADVADRTALGAADVAKRRANDCLEARVGAHEASDDAGGVLAQFLNTSARSHAYGSALRAIGGRVYMLTPEDQLLSACQY